MAETADHGATSIGLFILADDYLNAARTAAAGVKSARSGPVRLLALHACELFLKAYLRETGSTHASMRKLNHDLAAHADLAMERGLALGKARYNDLRVVTEIKDYVGARYRAGGDAGLFSSAGASVRLTEAVREEVRVALGLNDLGMPKSP